MDNDGYGHFIIILAQQLLWKYANDNDCQKIYLLAVAGDPCNYYTNGLGFSIIGNIDKNDSTALYKNVSKELKECLEIEKAEDTKLVLLHHNNKISADTISFGQKITITLEVSIKPLTSKDITRKTH